MKFFPVALLMVCAIVGLVTARKNDIVQRMMSNILRDAISDSKDCFFCLGSCEGIADEDKMDACHERCIEIGCS